MLQGSGVIFFISAEWAGGGGGGGGGGAIEALSAN